MGTYIKIELQAERKTVAAEEPFGASCSSSVCLPSHTESQKTLRIYVWELGDDRSLTLCGSVFSSTMQPTGSMAPQPRLISSFSTLFRLICFSALCSTQQWAEKAFSSVMQGIFPAKFLRRSAKTSSTLCIYFCTYCTGGSMYSFRCHCQTDILSHKIRDSSLGF